MVREDLPQNIECVLQQTGWWLADQVMQQQQHRMSYNWRFVVSAVDPPHRLELGVGSVTVLDFCGGISL